MTPAQFRAITFVERRSGHSKRLAAAYDVLINGESVPTTARRYQLTEDAVQAFADAIHARHEEIERAYGVLSNRSVAEASPAAGHRKSPSILDLMGWLR